MKKLLFLYFTLLLSILPSSNAVGQPWGKAQYHYFVPSNGGKVYCEIVNKTEKTIRIGAHYEGCRYGDVGRMPWGEKRFQEIKGIETIPSKVELRYCNELKNEDYSVGIYTIVGLDWRAFYNCTQLISITLPNTVTDIKKQAFMGCSNLTNINLPSNIQEIDLSFAEGCKKLESVNLTKGKGSKYFSFNGILCCNEEMIFCPLNFRGDLNIPSTIKMVKEDVFANHNQLFSVIVNPGTSIGDRAFKNCLCLKKVILNDGVKWIGSEAFSDCPGIEQIKIPGSLKFINWNAFANCMSLKSVNICEGIGSIEHDAFSFCTSLREIQLPTTMKWIGEKVFMGCTALEKVILNPQIETIYKYAFFGCSNLTSINVPKETKTFEETFMDCDKLHLQ